MERDSTSRQRDAVDLLRFGLSFAGFLLAAAGVVTSSLPAAILGAILLLLIVASFRRVDDV